MGAAPNTTTRLSDLVVPSVFNRYTREMSEKMLALIKSGLVVSDTRIAALLAAGGSSFNMPFFKTIVGQRDSVGSDNPASRLDAKKISTGNQRAVRLFRTAAFSEADLSSVMTGEDPLGAMAAELGMFWDENQQFAMLQILRGIFKSNDLSDGGTEDDFSGDMTFNVYNDIATPLAGNKISSDAIIEACYTMGDKHKDIVAMAMHSKVAKTLRKQNVNDFIPASESQTGFEMYQGKILIEDDDSTVISGTNSDAYATYLFGRGALAFGQSQNGFVPQEVERDALAADGAGVETLVSRRCYTMHLNGFDFLSASVAGVTPSNTELATAANWDRVFNRKNIKVARLVTNI